MYTRLELQNSQSLSASSQYTRLCLRFLVGLREPEWEVRPQVDVDFADCVDFDWSAGRNEHYKELNPQASVKRM